MTVAPPQPSPRARRIRMVVRAVGAVSLLVVVLVLWRSGLLADFNLDALREWIAHAGPAGPLFYVLLFSFLQPFGLSAHIFLVAAGLLWPTHLGLPLGVIGLMGGCIVSFTSARYMGKEAVQKRIPPGLARHEQALADRGLRTVILLRFAFFTFFPLSLAMGVSKVGWRDFLLGSLIGCLPVACLDVLLAQQVAEWLAR